MKPQDQYHWLTFIDGPLKGQEYYLRGVVPFVWFEISNSMQEPKFHIYRLSDSTPMQSVKDEHGDEMTNVPYVFCQTIGEREMARIALATELPADYEEILHDQSLVGHQCEPKLPLPEPGKVVRCRWCNQIMWAASLYQSRPVEDTGVFVIERLDYDSMENHPAAAVTWTPIGYVTSRSQAEAIVRQADLVKTWVEAPQLGLRWKEIKPYERTVTTRPA